MRIFFGPCTAKWRFFCQSRPCRKIRRGLRRLDGALEDLEDQSGDLRDQRGRLGKNTDATGRVRVPLRVVQEMVHSEAPRGPRLDAEMNCLSRLDWRIRILNRQVPARIARAGSNERLRPPEGNGVDCIRLFTAGKVRDGKSRVSLPEVQHTHGKLCV